ncbi:MAG: aldehyde dehydrogenase family protein [Acidimicrobiales bacterium]
MIEIPGPRTRPADCLRRRSVVRVSADLAAAFAPGDQLLVVDGELLHIRRPGPGCERRSHSGRFDAFAAMGAVSDDSISHFFDHFAASLADDDTFAPIAAANEADSVRARQRGRSTTRLELTASMRRDMIAGLRAWRDLSSVRDSVIERVDHDGWSLEQRVSGLGPIGFVFEGRPNVFADACGVLRGGNTVVFRIGSDALQTALAIVKHALDPALEAAGLPPGSASLVASEAHAAGWAMCNDRRLALAVARGSGRAVAQLGTIARQAGVPVSVHGTGGAWLVASKAANGDRLEAVVAASLDRKVCNTLNTCCVTSDAAAALVPRVLAGLGAAARSRGVNPKIHVTDSARPFVPAGWFEDIVAIRRASGDQQEPIAEPIEASELGREWEWEGRQKSRSLLSTPFRMPFCGSMRSRAICGLAHLRGQRRARPVLARPRRAVRW